MKSRKTLYYLQKSAIYCVKKIKLIHSANTLLIALLTVDEVLNFVGRFFVHFQNLTLTLVILEYNLLFFKYNNFLAFQKLQFICDIFLNLIYCRLKCVVLLYCSVLTSRIKGILCLSSLTLEIIPTILPVDF